MRGILWSISSKNSNFSQTQHNTMNRLRFRAWDGYNMNYSIMVGKFGAFWVNSGQNNDGLNSNDRSSLTPFNTKCDQDTKVMQFTGIHDNNGKMIFESDIVEDDFGKKMVVVFNQQSAQFALVYTNDKGSSNYEILTANNGSEEDYFSNDNLVVIGNIYKTK